MFKFAIKTGIVLGAVYYSVEQGVWKHSVESTKICDNIYNAVSPYYNQAKERLPIEIPEFPKSFEVRLFLKQSWNTGVTASCVFLSNLPGNVSMWTKHGVDKIKNNEDIRNMFSSVGNSGSEKS